MPIAARGIAQRGISLARGIASRGISVSERQCYAYNFDGVDDRGVLANRAINPDGDIDIEFRTGSTLPPSGFSWTIVSQNITSTSANREFGLYTNNSNALQLLVGGSFSGNMGQPLEANTKYRVTLSGAVLTYYKNDTTILTTSFTRGASREPGAVTSIAARNVSASVWGSYYTGQLYDIKINGVLWEMGERNQAVQPSIPAGNNMTLINTTSDRWEVVACRLPPQMLEASTALYNTTNLGG